MPAPYPIEETSEDELWTNEDGLIHRPLPARSVDEFYTGEVGRIRLYRGHRNWWIDDTADHVQGLAAHKRLHKAMEEAHAILRGYEAEAPGLIAKDAGLETLGLALDEWRIVPGAILTLTHEALPDLVIAIDQDRSITVVRDGAIAVENATDQQAIRVAARLWAPAPAP